MVLGKWLSAGLILWEVLDRLCVGARAASWLMHCWSTLSIDGLLARLLLQGGPGTFEGNCKVLLERHGSIVPLSPGGPEASGGDCKALSGGSGGDTFLSPGGLGVSGGDCKASSGGDVEEVLLLRNGPGCECKAPSGGSGGSRLATDTISSLRSGVASAPPGLQRASIHGISVRSSLIVCCWPWGPALLLWLVLALKSFVIIV